jgi:hypothetical protein
MGIEPHIAIRNFIRLLEAIRRLLTLVTIGGRS